MFEFNKIKIVRHDLKSRFMADIEVIIPSGDR